MQKENLTFRDAITIMKYSAIGTVIMLITFILCFCLVFRTFFVVDESDAITTGGAGQLNQEIFPGDVMVVNKATVDDLVEAQQFLTLQTGLDGTTTIPLTSLYIGVSSDGGDVMIDPITGPRIAAGDESGDVLTLIGLSNTDKILLEDGNGLSMSTSVTLGEGDTLTLKWNEDESLWEMITSDTK